MLSTKTQGKPEVMTKGAPLAYSDTERWSFIHTFTELTLHTRSPSTAHVPRKSSSRPWPSDLLGIAGRRLADPLPALAHADARLPPADRRRADALSPSSPAAPRRRPQDRLDEEQNRWERGVANPAMRHRCRCSRSPWADLRRSAARLISHMIRASRTPRRRVGRPAERRARAR